MFCIKQVLFWTSLESRAQCKLSTKVIVTKQILMKNYRNIVTLLYLVFFCWSKHIWVDHTFLTKVFLLQGVLLSWYHFSSTCFVRKLIFFAFLLSHFYGGQLHCMFRRFRWLYIERQFELFNGGLIKYFKMQKLFLKLLWGKCCFKFAVACV